MCDFDCIFCIPKCQEQTLFKDQFRTSVPEKYSSFLERQYKEKDSCETQNSEEKYNLLINIDVSVDTDISQVTNRDITHIQNRQKKREAVTPTLLGWRTCVVDYFMYILGKCKFKKAEG